MLKNLSKRYTIKWNMENRGILYDMVRKSDLFKQVFKIVKSLVHMTISLDDPDFKNRFVPLTDVAQNPYCMFLRSKKEGIDICSRCDELHRKLALQEKNSGFYECDFGLMDIVIPMKVEGKLIGYLVGGQIHCGKPKKLDFNKLAPRMKFLNKQELKKAKKMFIKTPVIEKEKLNDIVVLLGIFIEYLCRLADRMKIINDREKDGHFAVKKAKEYISANYTGELSLVGAANAGGVSPQYLSSIFHKEAGVKFNDYANIVRVEKAKEILKNSPKKTITEVFIASGFNSIQNFNRVFKKNEKKSPRKYRQYLH